MVEARGSLMGAFRASDYGSLMDICGRVHKDMAGTWNDRDAVPVL